jgi:hypothetical protein
MDEDAILTGAGYEEPAPEPKPEAVLPAVQVGSMKGKPFRPVQPGEAGRNPTGKGGREAMLAYKKAIVFLNRVTDLFETEEVQARIRQYIVHDAKPASLIRLAMAITEREDRRGLVSEAGALLGVSMAQLAAVIRAGGSREAVEVADYIDAEVVEVAKPEPEPDRADDPPEKPSSDPATVYETPEEQPKTNNKGRKRKPRIDIGL